MGILLGLGNAQLRFALFCQIFAHHVCKHLRTERHLHVRHCGVVLRKAHVIQRKTAVAALEARKTVVYKGARNLPRAVGTEVEEHNAVPGRYAAALTRDGRHDKFIRYALGVAVRHHLCGRAVHALAVHHRGVGLLHALPAVIAVHRVVAARDRGNSANADLVHFGLQFLDKALAGIGRHIAAVHDGMHINLLQARAPGHFQQRIQVRIVAVHAAIGNKANQVQRSAVFFDALHRARKRGVFKEAAVLNILGNARQLLINDAPCADVGMAHLAVAHLAVRQADIHARGTDGGIRILREQTVQVRRFCGGNGVAVGLVRHPAKAVHNAKKQRLFQTEQPLF